MTTPAATPSALAQAKALLHAAWQMTPTNPALAADVLCQASHPLNTLHGRAAVDAQLWQPLRAALPDATATPYIAMAGTFNGETWACATGDITGTFAHDWLGIPATRDAVRVRYGTFGRVEGGAIVEMLLLLDLLDLMAQAGYQALAPTPGRTHVIPGPRAADGLLTVPQDPATTQASLDLVEAMIFKGLMTFDQQSLATMGMARYWTPDMHWYGPAAIGSAHSLAEFEDFHQRPFLVAFPDRKGGNHDARFAEGLYVASTGWPSIHATFAGPWLGVPPSGARITMRVMDWWRRDGDLLAENWVFIDIPHVLLQAGHDVWVGLAAWRAGNRR